MKFQFTNEQTHALDVIRKRPQRMKIEAFAGAAKTTMLVHGAQNLPGAGLFLAFNRAIADSAAQKLPHNCRAMSFHQLAFRDSGFPFQRRLNIRINGSMVASNLGISAGIIPRSAMGSLAIGTVRGFCKTLDPEIKINHVPDYILTTDSSKKKDIIKNDAVKWARKLWSLMSDPDGQFPSMHDVYLRLFAEKKPNLNVDYILFDEAQDADALMLNILTHQDCPVIFVGDRWQQIYAWRGAVNAMDKIDTKYTVNLTQSFRFGPEIAARGDLVLKKLGENKSLKGFETVKSRVVRLQNYPQAIITRTNAEAAAALFENEHRNVATTGLSEAKEFFRAYIGLLTHNSVPPQYSLFSSVSELEEYTGSDEGADLKPYFKLLSTRTPNDILDRLNSIEDYKQGQSYDVLISTAHKCKGLEFPRVKLGPDFIPFRKAQDSEKITIDNDELRLLYVALTRASEVLDDSNVAWDRLFIDVSTEKFEDIIIEDNTSEVNTSVSLDNDILKKARLFDLFHEIWQNESPETAWKMIDSSFLTFEEKPVSVSTLSKRWGISSTKTELFLEKFIKYIKK